MERKQEFVIVIVSAPSDWLSYFNEIAHSARVLSFVEHEIQIDFFTRGS